MKTVDPENHLHKTESRWFAVYTRYKREKLVQKRLAEKGIDAYLPIQRFTRTYTRKRKEVDLPLISCYIFTRIIKDQYVPVLETPDVVDFVHFSRNLIAIPEKEIEIMRRVAGEGIEVDVERTTWESGDMVEIISGQLTGLRGKLVEQRNQKNFLIELENLGYSMRLYIEPAFLRKVQPMRSC